MKEKLPRYSSVGGYPLFYLTKDDRVLCPDCANSNHVAHANWEDPLLFCDECEERIESAYAEED